MTEATVTGTGGKAGFPDEFFEQLHKKTNGINNPRMPARNGRLLSTHPPSR